MPVPKQLQALQAEFATSEHKNRSQGGKTLTYIDIAQTIKRVNEVLGANWSILPGTKTTILPTSEGGFGAMTEVHIRATIDGVEKRLYGVGAMTNRDPDMAVKTALAEAIKKAFHQVGVALYLWDEEARDRINQRQAAGESPAARKRVLKSLAAEKLGIENPSREQIAAAFDTTPEAIAEDDGISAVLKAEGVLT
jgi:hypothetical protein